MGNSPTWFILHWIVSAFAVLVTARLVSGFQIRGFFAALLAAIGIGLANAVLWPILFFLTLPINLITLGLFTFVVNGAVLKIAAAFIPGFKIVSWWSAIVSSIVLTIVSLVLHYFLV
jgi:putative membrane protein